MTRPDCRCMSCAEPDVDEVAVDRACRGDRTVALTRDEMAAALHRLDAAGLSAQEIGARLGISDRSVYRWRAGETRPKGRAS